MACVINVSYTTNIQDLLAKGFEESKNFNGIFEGDAKRGFFSFPAFGGTFTGTYQIGGNVIEIRIEKKPILIPCSIIETFIKIHVK